MIALGTAERGAVRRRFMRLNNGFEYHKGEWLESEPGTLSPTAFLVEQGPHSVLPTHFHVQNEFQVVVRGSGTFGRHPVRSIGVHYAGAYTGYGPIIAGEEGLAYFTIRSVLESGAFFLPQEREDLKPGPRLQRYGEPIDLAGEDDLRSLSAPVARDVIPCEGGMVARTWLLPPGAPLTDMPDPASTGHFVMVLSGSLVHAGSSLRHLEMVFVSPDETAAHLAAGPDGVHLLLMQIPHREQVFDTVG